MSPENDELHRKIDAADQRIRRAEDTLLSVEASMKSMADNMGLLQAAMSKVAEVVVLQEEHRKALERCFGAVEGLSKKHDALEVRVRGVEVQLPVLNLTSGWAQRWGERGMYIGAGGGVVLMVLKAMGWL